MGKVIETISDSIAIEILNEKTVLIGKGNELHLYYKSSTESNVFDTQTLAINLANKIHGIKKTQNSSDKIVLIYGEKEFLLLEYNENLKFDEVYRAELSDWISNGLIFNKSKQIVLLTAHSILLRFSYNVATQKCCLVERISCIDKSTLYCAHLFGNEWNELIIFGGNAFGELLLWQPSINRINTAEPLKPKISPLLHRISAHNGAIFSIDYDHESQCLITTSDDRAVKWWKLEFKTQDNWSELTFQALSSGYGHLARVFRGRIFHYSHNVYAVSSGEDSCICLWNKNGQLLFKRRQQYKAIIWNIIYDNNTKTIYTVGSTGNLVAFDSNHILNETQNPANPILLPALTAENSIKFIAKVKFLNEKHLIGVTNGNDLMTSTFKGNEWLQWENSKTKLDFKCTVLEKYENVIAICGYKRLKLLEYVENVADFITLYDEEVVKGLIRTFVFFNKQHYLICDDQGSCLVILNSVQNKRYLKLPKCKEPWLTTALLLNHQEHITISNRQGNLLLYQYHQGTNNYDLKDIVKHPHGNLGATYLNCIEEKTTSALIRSVGHDGACNVFTVDFINNVIKTCSREIIPVAWTELIEKFNNNQDLFLGFNDNHFVVWCKHYDFLMELPCGGGHRCWTFIIIPKTNTICLAFIKNRRVRFYRKPLFNQAVIKFPMAKRWHIAPCNAIEILPQTSTTSIHIVVTGGDDNILKIHTFKMDNGLKEHKEVHNHISNIRCIKVLHLNDKEFLIFSGGGRAQLCVTQVNSSNFHINELINYTLKQENNKNCNIKSYSIDPETRLMSMDVKALNKEEYEIYLGCSDGFIKRLKLNLKTSDIILSQYFYNKCILQIRHVPELDLIIVAATNGLLKFFDNTLSKCLHQLQHHSSGVNGLSVLYNNSNNSLHILSGGDDQSIQYTELSLKALDFRVIKQIRKPYLHTSQVSACALSSNGLYGFTSGVDQVLNKLDLRTGEVIENFYSCVADIKGVALIDDNVCLLYGCGLQSYAFNS